MSFAIRVTDDRTAKHFERGVRLASKGQYREALKCFEKVLSIAELCGILGDEAIRRRGLPAPG